MELAGLFVRVADVSIDLFRGEDDFVIVSAGSQQIRMSPEQLAALISASEAFDRHLQRRKR